MFAEERQDQIEINVTPIINVIFLLLIFFIVTGTLKQSEVLPVEAPRSIYGEKLYADPVEILVNQDSVILNLELVEDYELFEILRDMISVNSEVKITLKADAGLPAERLVSVLQKIKRAGGKNIFLVTKSPF